MITAFVNEHASIRKVIVSGTPNLAVAEGQPPAEQLPSNVRAVAESAAEALPPATVWVDLAHPSPTEIAAIERALGIEIPTIEEMREIEASSRLYSEDRYLVMTAPVVHRATGEFPESGSVAFILLPEMLVTVRFVDPMPFAAFARRLERTPSLGGSGQIVLLSLLESLTDRLADILELAQADMERISREIFGRSADTERAGKGPDLKDTLRRVGRGGDIATKARDSLLGFSRIALFLGAQADLKKDTKARIKTLSRDIASITDHAQFLAGKVNFLLDATLGLINIEQNAIIKIFTVAAVAFLPPTLIASIYGMNFEFMPELHWDHGYLLAIGLMVLSAILPMWFFRRRGWL